MRLAFLIYFILVLWWAFLFKMGLKETPFNYYYNIPLGLLPICSGILSLFASRGWGGWMSAVGRGVIFLSIGLICWGLGTWVYGFYNLVLDIPVPYPSLGDVLYLASWPCWGIGLVHLSKATGVRFSLRHRRGQLTLFLVPLFATILSYFLLVVVARGGVLTTSSDIKLFFDIGFPLGDVVILTISLLILGLSAEYLGPRFKWPICIIVFGFLLNYVSDLLFSYRITIDQYFIGDWVDLLFATSMFFQSIGVLSLNPKKLGYVPRSD